LRQLFLFHFGWLRIPPLSGWSSGSLSRFIGKSDHSDKKLSFEAAFFISIRLAAYPATGGMVVRQFIPIYREV
jgi:hypothetical protein